MLNFFTVYNSSTKKEHLQLKVTLIRLVHEFLLKHISQNNAKSIDSSLWIKIPKSVQKHCDDNCLCWFSSSQPLSRFPPSRQLFHLNVSKSMPYELCELSQHQSIVKWENQNILKPHIGGFWAGSREKLCLWNVWLWSCAMICQTVI